MENYHEILLAALIPIATLVMLSRVIFKSPSQLLKLPPGPKPWPIIGNINLLLDSSLHKSLHSLSQKYGEIMLLRLGKFPLVVASSPHMAKQFLKVHDANFASRPALATGKYTAYNYSDMTWAPYGPYWRQGRKIFDTEVLNAKKLELSHPVRVEQQRNFLSRLHSMSGKPVVLREQLSRYTLSNISRLVLSNEYFCETKQDLNESIFKFDEFQGLLDEMVFLDEAINIGDWIPWLGFLDVQGYVKRMKHLFKKLDRFSEFVIDDHQARRRAAENDFTPNDVVDKLLLLVDKPNLEVKLSKDCIKSLLLDLLAGGTDTSTSTVQWAIHEVLRHPRVAKEAKEELDRVIGRSRWVEESDLAQLPYIKAIIMESWRLHPPSPLLTPHYAIEDCKVEGYDIPKGTTVFINTWSIGRDPSSWDAPEEFLPERFLGEDVDVTGGNFALLPFGSGKRRCPAYKLGLKIVLITLANLLHGFELRVAEEHDCGHTKHPKESLKLIMEPTLPPHLY